MSNARLLLLVYGPPTIVKTVLEIDLVIREAGARYKY